MGNGSPRLLKQLVRRTAVVALASLVFAPSAFADDGVVTVSADLGAVSATVAVPVEQAQSAPPRATVAAPSPASSVAVPVAPQPVKTPAAADPGLRPSTPAQMADSMPEASSGMSSTSSSRRVANLRRSELAQRERPSLPQRPVSIPRLMPAAASRGASRAAASSPPVPRFPIPSPSTFGLGGTSTAAPVGVSLLLLVLAAELAVLGSPGLGRRLRLPALSPRSHPYLFRLERPD